MADAEAIKNKVKGSMPKGGRKGGVIFPRIGLDAALTYSKKLVSKTAITPQPEATILAGVFNNAGSDGKIRLSALRQFGLIEGTSTAYKATPLAKDIETASDEPERLAFIKQALLKSKVLLELFNTYQGDHATKAKIKGRAQQLGVHPDASEACMEIFVASAISAKLAVAESDGIRLLSATEIATTKSSNDMSVEEEQRVDPSNAGDPDEKTDEPDTLLTPANLTKPRPRTAADVTLNLSIDSSWDGEKLEKHLATLRKFGLI